MHHRPAPTPPRARALQRRSFAAMRPAFVRRDPDVVRHAGLHLYLAALGGDATQVAHWMRVTAAVHGPSPSLLANALETAARHGRTDAVRLLAARCRTDGRRRALVVAALHRRSEVVAVLLATDRPDGAWRILLRNHQVDAAAWLGGVLSDADLVRLPLPSPVRRAAPELGQRRRAAVERTVLMRAAAGRSSGTVDPARRAIAARRRV